ncbi:hypothetical protein NIES4106_34080 [Fischerella sp. NIES-4106]|jgi:hypothetical protein|nr:hypothetical protein NIES4106_34080 [Fischerella sp. NIES-4106]
MKALDKATGIMSQNFLKVFELIFEDIVNRIYEVKIKYSDQRPFILIASLRCFTSSRINQNISKSTYLFIQQSLKANLK